MKTLSVDIIMAATLMVATAAITVDFVLDVSAAPVGEAAVRQSFVQRFPGIHVESVSKSPLSGLYEVYGDDQILYVDAEVKHVIQGTLIDAEARRNLTAERLGKFRTPPPSGNSSRTSSKLVASTSCGNGSLCS